MEKFFLPSVESTVCHWDDPPGSGMTFQDLDQRAGRVGEALVAYASPGDRVFICLPTGPEFLVAFFGCLYAGVVPAAVAPSFGKRRTDRLQPLINVANPVAMIGFGSSDDIVQGMRYLDLDVLLAGDGYLRECPATEKLAYLQFTSGSTSVPRAVMIPYSAILANLAAIDAAASLPSESVVASWLPMHHDMGLISALFALRYGHGLTLDRPEAFTRAPERWLEAISRHRAAFSGAPNFAYDLLNRSRAIPGPEMLDLSHWQIAFCGAEPIQPAVMRRFMKRYSAYGLRPATLSPSYGMAEFTLLASCAGHGIMPDAHKLADDRNVMSCGTTSSGHDVRIVDPESCRPLPDGEEGEIWLYGPSKGTGYWHDPEATEATFKGHLPGDDRHWLRTGDLGCLQHGDLLVLGRLKDVLIVRGRNLHAEEIETITGFAHPLLSSAVAAVTIEVNTGEGVGLACELNKTLPHGVVPAEIFEAIQRELSIVFGITADRISLVRRGGLPRTTSGKIRRADCRLRMKEGGLPILHDWQAGAPDPVPKNTPRTPSTEQVLNWILRWFEVRHGLSATGDTAVDQLGLDSLSALELTHDLEDWLRLPVASTAVFAATSLAALAEELTEKTTAALDNRKTTVRAEGFDLARRLKEIESMSDSEVERLLSHQMNLAASD